MDAINQTILIVVSIIASVGIFVGGIGYFVSLFRKGSKQEKSDVISSSQEVITFWKTQAENYQTILAQKEKEWNEKFTGITREFGELKGKYDAEKAQTDRLEKIFQNRDPESQKFMELVISAIGNQNKVNTEVVRVLSEIHTLAKDEHDREIHVESTVTKS